MILTNYSEGDLSVAGGIPHFRFRPGTVYPQGKQFPHKGEVGAVDFDILCCDSVRQVDHVVAIVVDFDPVGKVTVVAVVAMVISVVVADVDFIVADEEFEDH